MYYFHNCKERLSWFKSKQTVGEDTVGERRGEVFPSGPSLADKGAP